MDLTNVIALIGLIVNCLFQWVKASHQERDEVRKLSIRLLGWVTIFLIIANSIKGIADFGVSDAPMTRLSVLILLLHCFNLTCYFLAALALRHYRTKKKTQTLMEPT